MENRYLITLDFKQRPILNMNFVQNNIDTGAIEFIITDGGQVVDITGQTIEITFLKPDKTLVIQDVTTGVTILEGPNGKLECILKSNTLAAVGIVRAEISFSLAGKKLSTAQFMFNVSGSLNNDEAIISTNEIPLLDAKILEATNKIAEADAKIIGIQEQYDIESAAWDLAVASKLDEATAKIVETEAARQLAITAAGNADLATDNANTAEILRVGAEDGRVTQEITRQTNEANRVTEFQTMLDSTIKKYTAIFSGSTSAGTRADNAVGMVANAAVDGAIVVNDFDNVSFFDRPMCNVYHDAAGMPHVMAYRGEPGFDPTGGIFPPYAVKSEVFYECTPCYWNGSYEAPSVTGTPCEGYELFEVFPNAVDKIYLPVYWLSNVDGKATSRSGTVPTYDSLNGSMASARTYNAANAHTETMAAHMYEYVLQLVEFATKDVQNVMMGASSLSHNSATDVAVITEAGVNRIVLANAIADKYVVGQSIVIGTSMNGTEKADRVCITSIEVYDASNKAVYFDGNPVDIAVGNFVSSRAWKNGATDIVVASSGSPGSNASGKYPCIWRGKVSPWADGFSGLCDVLVQRTGTGPYVYTPFLLSDPRKYAAGVITADYVELRYKLPGVDGYAKALSFDSRFDHAALTNEIGAASTTYLAAYYYYPRYDVCVVCVGGYWNFGRYCSPVYFFCGHHPSLSYVFRLARLFVTRS